MRSSAFLALAFALALALGGCIENMRDLKSRLDSNGGGPLQTASVTPSPAPGDASAPAGKPPVARITIFGAAGALVYKSSFVAEDITAPILVNAGDNLTLMASDSEALVGTLASYSWDIAGRSATGTKATASWKEPGVYPIRLMVTDSNGLTDNQTVTLGIAPPPFTVTQNQTSGQMAGANVQGQVVGSSASVKFDVAVAHAGKPAVLMGVKLATTAIDSCDADVEVVDKDGKSVAKASSGGVGAAETLDLGILPEGTYTVKLTPGDACAAKDGVRVSFTETFIPLVNGVLLMSMQH